MGVMPPTQRCGPRPRLKKPRSLWTSNTAGSFAQFKGITALVGAGNGEEGGEAGSGEEK